MSNQIKRIGVLTSGGDAPGMNAAVRAVVRSATSQGVECIGIRRGWSGLINSDFVRLDSSSVSHIINKGGTLLYTARDRETASRMGYEAVAALLAGKGNRVIASLDGHIVDLDMEAALAMVKPFDMERYDVLEALTNSGR